VRRREAARRAACREVQKVAWLDMWMAEALKVVEALEVVKMVAVEGA